MSNLAMAATADTVAIVMVNWNGWRDTVRAHTSLLGSTFTNWRLIVVDNASADGSFEQLLKALPSATIIGHPENSGFAGGCNIGIARALALGCKYVFLLNNDATVEPDTLAALVEASAKLGDEAILGSAVKLAESGGYQFFGSRTCPDLGHPSWFKEARDGAALSQDLIETDFVLGAALFVPSAVLGQSGLFDERFYLNFEETDLCYRARKQGVRCFVVPKSIVNHRAGSSVGHINGPLQTYFMTRNALLFGRKHATPMQRARFYKRRMAWFLKRLATMILCGETIDRSTKSEARAILDYITRRFGDCPPIIRQYAEAERRSRLAG